MKKNKNLLLFLLCGAVFLTFGLGSTSEISDEISNINVTKDKFSYTIDRQYSDTFAYYIEGIVTNKTDQEYSYVQIDFVCYDKDGNNLGTAVDNTNNLLGNQTWKYKAMFLGTEGKSVDHCDYHETTSW